eukprot:682415-Amphidinium_carterae.1
MDESWSSVPGAGTDKQSTYAAQPDLLIDLLSKIRELCAQVTHQLNVYAVYSFVVRHEDVILHPPGGLKRMGAVPLFGDGISFLPEAQNSEGDSVATLQLR